MAGIKTIHDANALLLYKVGPVYCCSPTMPVVSVQMPPRLNHPPGSNPAQPGMFKYATGMVRVVDLRKRFGVDEEDWQNPGRIVVVEVKGGLAGFWVDEIIDVVQYPETGWGNVPALVPRTVFSRTLLFNEQIQLYADFDKLNEFHETGYLRRHIQELKARLQKKAVTEPADVYPAGSAQPAIKESGGPVDTGKIAIQKNASPDRGSLEVSNAEQRPAEQTAAKMKPDINADSQEEVTQALPAEKPLASQAENTGKDQSTILSGRVADNRHKYDDSRAKPLPYSKTGKPPRSPVTTATVVHRPVAEKPMKQGYEDRPLRKSVVPAPDQQQMAHRKIEPDRSTNNNSAWYLLVLFLSGIAVGVYLYSDTFFATQPFVDDSKHVTRPAVPGAVQPLAEEWQPEETFVKTSEEVTDKVTPADRKIPSAELLTSVDVEDSQAAESAAKVLQNNHEAGVEVKAPMPTEDDESAPAIDSVQDAYHASIDRDEQGVVIVLNQPDEPFKAETVQTVTDDTDRTFIERQSGQQLQLAPSGTETSASQLQNNAKEENAAPVVAATVTGDQQQNVPVVVTEKIIIHIVVKGDTLWHIAKRYINNPYRYPELARLSRIKNPDLIYPGNRVKIIINRKSVNRKRPPPAP